MLTTHLHIEASSYCNARCPGCPRNGYGYPLEGLFKQTHLDLLKYEQILAKYPDLITINFCGNHGDPMMHPEIVKLCEPSKIKFSIATNGSIGRLDSYIALAKLGVEITFGIDGLENTNHLYRQGVIWNNLMSRVKTFIDAGGQAIWQFIKFQHNMDQIEEARSLSTQLGFKQFDPIDVGRNHMPAIQPDKTISHWILPPDKNAKPTNFDVDQYIKMRTDPKTTYYSNRKIKAISCEHLGGSTYVNSEGELFPCCYQGFGHVDRPKIFLKDFPNLQKNWNTKSCNPICADSCGR